MKLALYQPDIPQNTGTMLRLAACLNVPVEIIGPAAFDMSDKALRRAALDYLAHVQLSRHINFHAFERKRAESGSRLLLLSSRGKTPYTQFQFQKNDILLVGRESAGVPQQVFDTADAALRIPVQPPLRSLNVAVSAAMVLGEAMRQVFWTEKPASNVRQD